MNIVLFATFEIFLGLKAAHDTQSGSISSDWTIVKYRPDAPQEGRRDIKARLVQLVEQLARKLGVTVWCIYRKPASSHPRYTFSPTFAQKSHTWGELFRRVVSSSLPKFPIALRGCCLGIINTFWGRAGVIAIFNNNDHVRKVLRYPMKYLKMGRAWERAGLFCLF